LSSSGKSITEKRGTEQNPVFQLPDTGAFHTDVFIRMFSFLTEPGGSAILSLMRKQTVILVILLIAAAVLFAVHRRIVSAEFPSRVKPVEIDVDPALAEPPTGIPNRLVFDDPREIADIRFSPSPSGGLKQTAKDSFYRYAEKRQGSYTNFSNLFRNQNGEGGLTLRSEWFTPYLPGKRGLPDMSLRIIKNPKTGEYEAAGGNIGIPYSPLEAGYEVDPGTEEQKAVLQWKKTF
jgi:hypothetical protein